MNEWWKQQNGWVNLGNWEFSYMYNCVCVSSCCYVSFLGLHYLSFKRARSRNTHTHTPHHRHHIFLCNIIHPFYLFFLPHFRFLIHKSSNFVIIIINKNYSCCCCRWFCHSVKLQNTKERERERERTKTTNIAMWDYGNKKYSINQQENKNK